MIFGAWIWNAVERPINGRLTPASVIRARPDLDITASTFNANVGGNLAEILDTISFTIRNGRIKGENREINISYVPVKFLLSPHVCNRHSIYAKREYINVYFSLKCTFGYFALGLAALLIAAGYFTMTKLGDIEV
jgi:tight adherence protein B